MKLFKNIKIKLTFIIFGLIILGLVFIFSFFVQRSESKDILLKQWDKNKISTQLKKGIIDPEFKKYFDRDPERQVPNEKNIIVSPADGKIVSVRHDNTSYVVQISLSLLNVHVQRIPLSGKVFKIEKTGLGFLGNKQIGHLNNVQTVTALDTKIGRIIIKQITAWDTRRIVNYMKKGQNVKIGDRLGRILLGSTVVIILPDKVKLNIKVNQPTLAGETIIAKY